MRDIFYLENPDSIGVLYPENAYNRLDDNIKEMIGDRYQDGAIQMPKLYGLKVRERREARQFLESQATIQAEVAKLVLKKAEESGESVEVLSKALDDPNQRIIFFADHIEKVQELIAKQELITEDLALITAIMQSRLNKKWTLDDSLELPESLYFKLQTYIDAERAGWPELEAPKSQSVSQSDDPPNQKRKSQTGKKSTLNSEESSQTPVPF